MQHGSILFDYDRDLIEELFSEKIEKDALTCLSQINPNLGFEDVKKALAEDFDCATIGCGEFDEFRG